MRYDAFISYRHSELDMEIAKKLHRGLETFVIPSSVRKKYGKKKIERVFRDQEELPIGSDLDDNITSALKESEYLIVICSPRTPKSVWVCKEIDTFIKLHDRNHVLAILIEGEPNESFPAQLLVDENGKPVEPLAADIRGETRKERDKKFKTELMRLCAPLIGCEYDDLKQRHRERIIRRNVCFAAAIMLMIAALGVAFGLYNAMVARNMELLAKNNADLAMEKSMMAGQIFDQFQETQKNQSRFYAERSLSLLDEGKREAAILTAIEGLPREGEEERPYVPESEYALSAALHVYYDGSLLDYDRLLHHEQIVKDMRLCGEGKYLVTVDRNDNVYLWDTQSWEQKVMVPFRTDENYYVETVEDVFADDNGLYVTTSGTFTAYDHKGQELYHIDGEGDYLGAEFCRDEKKLALISLDEVSVVDLSGGKVSMKIDKKSDESFNSRGNYIGDGVITVTHMSGTDQHNFISLVDTVAGEITDADVRYGHILRTAGSEKGYTAVLSCNPDFYMGAGVQQLGLDLIDKEGTLLWSVDLDIQIVNPVTFSTQMKIQDFNDRIVVVIENGAYIYDTADGSETGRIGLFGDANAMLLSGNSKYGCIGYSSGVMDWIDTDNAVIVDAARIETGIGIMDMQFVGDQRIIRTASSDLCVLSYQKGVNLESLPDLERREIAEAVEPGGAYYVMTDYMDGKMHDFYDAEGKLLYSFDKSDHYAIDMFCMKDKALILTMDGLWEIEPAKKSAVLNDYQSMGSQDSYTEGWFSGNGKYCVMWNGRNMGAFDVENKSLIYSEEAEDTIGCAVITEDGSKIYLSQSGINLTEIEIDGGDKREYEDVNLRETANSSGSPYLTVSRSGKRAAMFCADGKLRIINTEDGMLIAAIPVQVKLSSYIRFDDKEKHLIFQGDDHTVYIWDTEKNEYSSIIDTAYDLKYVITDDKADKVICCDGVGLHVLEALSFVRIAYVPDGVAYIVSENSFIQNDGTRVYKNSYMDHKQLIEEAKRQFPDAKLGPKEKKEYNIE
ncbi:MAG: toll/interleukin-1 receptor domain-containing protein [Lachnospiraceae bacterium]|nr:toll/interleukin-1 receptor domain-containing protein [Lachnospiraceae bacterium]